MKWFQDIIQEWKQRAEETKQKKAAAQWERAKEEVSILYKLVQQSQNAKTFVESCTSKGFQLLGEDLLGVSISTKEGNLIVSVMASHHASNIFCLVYKPTYHDTICLVD